MASAWRSRTMKHRLIEPELVALRKLSEELARERKERLSSGHLLAAIASTPGAAADLLAERKLDPERLLRAARAVSEDVDDPIRAAVQRARGIAARLGADVPVAIHVLVALANERRSAAHQALLACGVDVGRLRGAALSVGQGLIGRRRLVTAEAALLESSAAPRAAVAKPVSRATAIPVMPPREHRPRGRTASTRGELVPDPTCPSRRAPGRSSEPPPPPAAERASAVAPVEGPSAERFELDGHTFPTLVGLGRNITAMAARGELEPVVGREDLVEETLDVLAKRQGNSPLLVGVAGVGKTSVVRALAQHIVSSSARTDDRVVVEVPVNELLAGTGVRGALAMRFGAIRKEVGKSGGRVVLFFDDVHQLFTEANEELTSELRQALSKGELPCIGATTPEAYKKLLDGDAALARRFTLIEVDEPSREDAFLVLETICPKLEEHHGVRYQTEALALAVGWSVRYLPGRALPDKALGVIDLAGARTRRRGQSVVDADVVAEVIAEAADVPVERLLESDGARFLGLESLLAERVVGHDAAMRRIARILRRNAAGLGSQRPIGTFLLLGPTGVGKTETAKAIAEVLFHADNAMTRIDLSEYSEPHSVARLIGAPPGYVGHESGGLLTESVRRRPYQVLLLDEIEKAHSDVLEAFLGVFDEGRLTDGRGRTVDFTNTVILLTSNLGADESGSSPRRRVGFGASDAVDHAVLESRVTAAARAALTPELYNRIDEVLVYSPLSRSEVSEVARRLLQGLARTLGARRGVRLQVEPEAIDALLEQGGYDPALGARPMKRAIARLIEAPLAEKILSGELGPGDSALITAADGELQLATLSSQGAPSAAE